MFDTIPASVLNDSLKMNIEALQDTLNVIANNTYPTKVMEQDLDMVNFWLAIVALFIGGFGTYFGWLAYRFSKKTADNVVRMSANTQLAQFNDVIRHLYRNLIVSISFSERQLSTDSHYFYPSEVHLQKLKLLPEDTVHLEKYNDNTDIYKVMHELKLLMRNYDTEIDIAQVHLKEQTLGHEVLKEDLDGLCYKPFYLIQHILEVECAMEHPKKEMTDHVYAKYYHNMMLIILSEHFEKLAENMKKFADWKEHYVYKDYCDRKVSDAGRAFEILRSEDGNAILKKEDFLNNNPYLKDKARSIFDHGGQEMAALWELTEKEGLKEMIQSEEWNFVSMLSVLISVDVAIEYSKIKFIHF